MRKSLLIVAMIAIVSCGQDSGEAPEILVAKDAVGDLLLDASSAQFEAVAAEGAVVCGLVNAKNRMGAYTGFQGFIVENDIATLDTGSEDFGVRFGSTCPAESSREYIDRRLAQIRQRTTEVEEMLTEEGVAR